MRDAMLSSPSFTTVHQVAVRPVLIGHQQLEYRTHSSISSVQPSVLQLQLSEYNASNYIYRTKPHPLSFSLCLLWAIFLVAKRLVSITGGRSSFNQFVLRRTLRSLLSRLCFVVEVRVKYVSYFLSSAILSL